MLSRPARPPTRRPSLLPPNSSARPAVLATGRICTSPVLEPGRGRGLSGERCRPDGSLVDEACDQLLEVTQTLGDGHIQGPPLERNSVVRTIFGAAQVWKRNRVTGQERPPAAQHIYLSLLHLN